MIHAATESKKIFFHIHSKCIPSFVSWKCIHGECDLCEKHELLSSCESLKKCEKMIKFLSWKNALLPGKNKGVVDRSQREPTQLNIQFNEVKDMYKKQLIECARHVNEADIRNAQRSKYISTFDEKTIVIFTDFSATMDLAEKVKDNFYEDNNVVLDVFLVFHNPREYQIQKIDGTYKKMRIKDFDSFGYFASSQ